MFEINEFGVVIAAVSEPTARINGGISVSAGRGHVETLFCFQFQFYVMTLWCLCSRLGTKTTELEVRTDHVLVKQKHNGRHLD